MFTFGFEELQIAGLQPSLLDNKLKLLPKTLSLMFMKIRPLPNGCWEWMGARQKGYGAIRIRALAKGLLRTHRVTFELVNGPLLQDEHLHHKTEDGCIGPSCCNPAHLQKTTPAIHVRDLTPGSASYIAARRDCCAKGHEYTVENTRIVKGGSRQCRECDKVRAQERRDYRRASTGREKYAKDPDKLKTECFRGHSLEDAANVRWINSPSGPQRVCRECDKIRSDWHRDKKKHEYVDPPTAIMRPDDRCKRGHLLSGKNVYLHPDGKRRSCLACRQLNFSKYGDEMKFKMAPPIRLPVPYTAEELAAMGGDSGTSDTDVTETSIPV